jgi:3-deoxy-D-manno-octulosonate 8-phosphate phosphatase (KDO 8-P phosphatase)
VYLGPREGDEYAAFDIQDGVGHRLAEAAGLPVVWLTGRVSAPVARRAERLRVTRLLAGRADKVTAARDWCRARGLSLRQVAFLGDDLIDIPLLLASGWAVAPANARDEVKRCADRVTRASGGFGAFREAVETLLKGQGRWPAVRRAYGRSMRPML